MIKRLQLLKYYLREKYFKRFKDRVHFEKWQQNQLHKALQRARAVFPFYKKITRDVYEQFPVINKQILMEHFNELNSANISRDIASEIAIHAEQTRDFTPQIGEIAVGLSTGTTGSRGIFLINSNERLRWAGTLLAKVLPGSLLKKRRIAFIFRANNHLYTTINSSRIQFKFFDLKQPFDVVLCSLIDFSPQIIVAPAQVLTLVAKYLANHPLRKKVEHIISVAEVLEKSDRERIEKTFAKKVHEIYQATEGFLATTCYKGTLHLNEDLLYFERQYLDEEKKRFVPIITDLFRETQAIIRYRLNDLLILKTEGCDCGSVFQALEKIEGRCDDIFFLPDITSQTLKPIFPDLLRNTIAKTIPTLTDFQLCQQSAQLIEIHLPLLADKNSKSLLKKNLAALFKQLKVQEPTLSWQEGIIRDPNKKLRRIERKFKVSENIL